MTDDTNTNPGILETVLETKDELDVFILQEIVQLPIQLMVESLIFWGDKNRYQEHLQQMIDLGKNLVKTNDSLRGYKKAEESSLKEFKEKCLKDQNTNIILTRRAPELEREVDSFLSGIKASLDLLAKILNPILGLKLSGWHRVNRVGRKGRKLSGADVLNALERSIPEELKPRITQLAAHVEGNLEWLTYLVWLRDSGHHHGGIKTISNISYDSNSKEIAPQYIMHTPERNEKVLDFMTRAMSEFNGFVNNFICLLYLAKAPNDMVLQRKENPVLYYWGIIQKP